MRTIFHFLSLKGRASRSEYAVVLGAGLLISLFGSVIPKAWMLPATAIAISCCNLLILYLWVAVSVRRLHDFGKSGWLLVFWVIPVVPAVILAWSLGRPAPATAAS